MCDQFVTFVTVTICHKIAFVTKFVRCFLFSFFSKTGLVIFGSQMSQMVTFSIVTGTGLFPFLFRLKWCGMNEIRKNIQESELCFCFLFDFRLGTALILKGNCPETQRVEFDFCCYATTQLAPQVQQERTQVVDSNKKARKRLTESNGIPAMDLRHMNVVLKWCMCMLVVDLGTVMVLFFLSFFLSLVWKTQANHCTTLMLNTRLFWIFPLIFESDSVYCSHRIFECLRKASCNVSELLTHDHDVILPPPPYRGRPASGAGFSSQQLCSSHQLLQNLPAHVCSAFAIQSRRWRRGSA